MSSLDSFEKGEDIYRSVALTVGGSAVDTADFDTIEVNVYHKYTLENIGSYSVAAGTVETPAPTSGGVITFIVGRSDNEDARTGIYKYEVITTETDTDYEDNTRYREYNGDCFILKDQ